MPTPARSTKPTVAANDGITARARNAPDARIRRRPRVAFSEAVGQRPERRSEHDSWEEVSQRQSAIARGRSGGGDRRPAQGRRRRRLCRFRLEVRAEQAGHEGDLRSANKVVVWLSLGVGSGPSGSGMGRRPAREVKPRMPAGLASPLSLHRVPFQYVTCVNCGDGTRPARRPLSSTSWMHRHASSSPQNGPADKVSSAQRATSFQHLLHGVPMSVPVTSRRRTRAAPEFLPTRMRILVASAARVYRPASPATIGHSSTGRTSVRLPRA